MMIRGSRLGETIRMRGWSIRGGGKELKGVSFSDTISYSHIQTTQFCSRSYSSSPLSRLKLSGNQLLFGIIGANALVLWGWDQAQYDRNLRRFLWKHFTISENGIFQHFRFHTLLTATFSHQTLGHFLGNMLTLYFFGSTALATLTIRQFSLLYFGGGILGSLGQVLSDRFRTHRQYFIENFGLGASGGVMSVLTWTIMTYPKSTVMIYFILPVPAAFVGLLYVGMDLYGYTQGQSGVGYAAHLVGTGYGAAMYFFFKHRNKILRRF